MATNLGKTKNFYWEWKRKLEEAEELERINQARLAERPRIQREFAVLNDPLRVEEYFHG